MQTLLVSLSAFAAGALVGVVLLSCWLRAVHRRLLIERRLDDSPKVRTTILNADDARCNAGERIGTAQRDRFWIGTQQRRDRANVRIWCPLGGVRIACAGWMPAKGGGSNSPRGARSPRPKLDDEEEMWK